MSVSAMTNAAFARRQDVAQLDTAQQAKDATSSVSAITTYIPTETLTLYVAVIAALQDVDQGSKTAAYSAAARLTEWFVFWFFLFFTPVVVWLLYAAKVKNAQKLVPLAPSKWPLWEMIAATIGFTAWAFALPNSPFREFSKFGWYSSALAGVMVLVVSTLLGLIAPLVQRPLPS